MSIFRYGSCLPLIVAAAFAGPPAAGADPAAPVPGKVEWNWVGNTHAEFEDDKPAGTGRWVQNFLDDMQVTPDGTVIAGCFWDEAGRCLGLYKDGRPAREAPGKNDRLGGHTGSGWGTHNLAVAVAGDQILVASLDGEFYRFGWKPGDIDSVRWKDGFQHKLGDKVKVVGLHARGGEVLVVLSDGRVQVRALADWKVLRSFLLPGASKVSWAPDGRCWFLVGAKLVQTDADGKPTGVEIADAGRPASLAFGPDGTLLVCDNGRRQQVRFYDVTGVAPRLLRTFGQEGGLSAGVPGEPLADKLVGPVAAGMDADGNLYVGMTWDRSTPTGGCIVRCFGPTGERKWECANYSFSVVYDALPVEGGLELYGPREVFFLPTGAKPGQWALKALTLDPAAQPADPRQAKMLQQATTVVRDLGGHRFLFSWGSGGNTPIQVTKYAGPGHLGEHAATVGPEDVWAWHVDSRGDIWREADGGKTILRYPFLGVEDGKPRWQTAKPESAAIPDGVTEVCRISYDPPSDAMILGVYSNDHPKPSGEWGLAGRSLRRYDGWLKGKRRLTWAVELPQDDAKLPPKAIAYAGEYVFVAACQPVGGLRGVVNVYAAGDGKFVGRICGGKEITQRCGWIDLSHGLLARRLPDGRYVITMEENYHGKMLVVTWNPSG